MVLVCHKPRPAKMTSMKDAKVMTDHFEGIDKLVKEAPHTDGAPNFRRVRPKISLWVKCSKNSMSWTFMCAVGLLRVRRTLVFKK